MLILLYEAYNNVEILRPAHSQDHEQGRLKAGAEWARAPSTMGASPGSRISLNKIVIRIISKVKYFFKLCSPKNGEFRTATCDDRLLCIAHAYHCTPSLLIQSKGGSRSSRFVRL
ncbi:hypothetical protein TNCV_1084021 [Trichonephila clavipes]|nr:hypothetical protein TNCV_1084021 [Trichonephila clavipes]